MTVESSTKPAKSSFLQRAASGIKQYAKEVVTGQRLVQNFFDSRSFDQWFAHGATEFANVLLHSHAAPLYAHALSPAEKPQSELTNELTQAPDMPANDLDVAPTTTPDPRVPETVLQRADYQMTSLAEHMDEIQAATNIQPPEPSLAVSVEAAAPEQAYSMTSLEQHMQEIQASPATQEPQQDKEI